MQVTALLGDNVIFHKLLQDMFNPIPIKSLYRVTITSPLPCIVLWKLGIPCLRFHYYFNGLFLFIRQVLIYWSQTFFFFFLGVIRVISQTLKVGMLISDMYEAVECSLCIGGDNYFPYRCIIDLQRK